MEESNISNSTNDVQSVKIITHFFKPEYIPVDTQYVDLEEVIDLSDDSVDEIFIGDVLDYITYDTLGNTIDTIQKKLKVGGQLIVQAPDLFHLASALVFQDLDIETTKLTIYNGKNTMYVMKNIETELLNRNFDILQKKYKNIFEYFLIAKKL